VKEIVGWLEENYARQSEEPRKLVAKVRMFNSRLQSLSKSFVPERPWWLELVLGQEISRIKNRFARADALMQAWEKDILPKFSDVGPLVEEHKLSYRDIRGE